MAEYMVAWHINMDAETPRQAAEQALAIMRDRGSDAVCFYVRLEDETPDEAMEIDLDDEDPDLPDCARCGARRDQHPDDIAGHRFTDDGAPWGGGVSDPAGTSGPGIDTSLPGGLRPADPHDGHVSCMPAGCVVK